MTVENQPPVTADWDGTSFSGVEISEFINVVEFHDMTISGKLISSTMMRITVTVTVTVTVTGSGTTKFNIGGMVAHFLCLYQIRTEPNSPTRTLTARFINLKSNVGSGVELFFR